MSEYQYYEFRAVDRSLTSREMASLRAISSRADITSTSFVNTYNYSDLRGDPEEILGKYFDAFVYVANWGTHEFSLRLPKQAFERRDYAPFCKGGGVSARLKGEHLLLRFRVEELEADWEEGEGWMDSLLPLRADLVRGDLRALYLGWLSAAGRDEDDDDQPEPPVPPGLGDLSEPLKSLVEFLEIDPDLLESAAEVSVELQIAAPSKEILAQWIAGLPECEKDALLLQVAGGENPHVGTELLRRFQSNLPAPPTIEPMALRTTGQLLAAAEARAQEKARRKERRKAAERAKQLDALEKREEAAWADLDDWVSTKRQRDYDRAVLLLLDLRDVAARAGRDAGFQHRLRTILERHSTKSSFLRRVKAANVEVRSVP